MKKDVSIAKELADAVYPTATLFGAPALDVLEKTIKTFGDDTDYTMVAKHVEKVSGVEIKPHGAKVETFEVEKKHDQVHEVSPEETRLQAQLKQRDEQIYELHRKVKAATTSSPSFTSYAVFVAIVAIFFWMSWDDRRWEYFMGIEPTADYY